MLHVEGQGSRHVSLVCRDVKKAARFFAEILEVPVDWERAEPDQPASFSIGPHTRIELYPSDRKGQTVSGQADPIALVVATRAELDYLVDKLEQYNVCYRGPVEQDESFHLYFETPDGHPLEVRLHKDEHDDT
jgi:glyoxylase I family protein